MICKHAPRVLSRAFAFFQNKKDGNLGCPLGKAACSEPRGTSQRVVSASGWGGTDGWALGGLAFWPAVSKVGCGAGPPCAARRGRQTARLPRASRCALGWGLRAQRARSEAGGCGTRTAWLCQRRQIFTSTAFPSTWQRRALDADVFKWEILITGPVRAEPCAGSGGRGLLQGALPRAAPGLPPGRDSLNLASCVPRGAYQKMGGLPWLRREPVSKADNTVTLWRARRGRLLTAAAWPQLCGVGAFQKRTSPTPLSFVRVGAVSEVPLPRRAPLSAG